MKTDTSLKAKIAAQIGLMVSLAVLGFGLPQRASAIGAGDADTMINGYNNAFLVTSGTSAYYKQSLRMYLKTSRLGQVRAGVGTRASLMPA